MSEQSAPVLTAEPTKSANTGKSLERDPRKLKAIEALVIGGMGKNSAARTVGVAPSTLSAYRKEHPEFDRTIKEKLQRLSLLCADRLEEDIQAGKVKPESNAITLGICLDKLDKLNGTALPAPAQSGPSIQSVLAELAQLVPDRSVTVKVGPAQPVIDLPETEQVGGGAC